MCCFSFVIFAQTGDSISTDLYFNSAEKMLQTDGNLKIGGYGEAHYNQPLSAGTGNNGKLDIHRLIMLLGYQFNERTQFVSELEFEHVNEIYVEQAFLQHKLNDYMNFRAGLLLAPMGIINEYHEPVLFNGVERPLLDNHIVPSTWRELGFGFSGLVLPLSIKYQAYVMSGFNGFDGEAQLGGSSGLRGGRQKAARAFVSSPDLALKLEYFGIRGLNTGISAYLGETESTLYQGVSKDDAAAMATADSSVVRLAMLGLDTRYTLGGFKLSAQMYYAGLSNTDQYNEFTADKNGGDLGSALFGYYVDLGYNVLKSTKSEMQLYPFVRYSNYDTHFAVQGITKNEAYHKSVVTSGVSLFLAKGAVLKADLQFIKDGVSDTYSKTFNAGFGVMF